MSVLGECHIDYPEVLIKKAWQLILLGCLAATIGLAGCSKGGNPASSDLPAAAPGSSRKEGVEIQWMFWSDLDNTTDLMVQGYAKVIERFNKTYEGVYHCTPITTNQEEYTVKLNVLIASGCTPDVFICNPGPNLNDVVAAGAAADLTDILKNKERAWYDSFTGGIFERLTYDGKIMAVPTNFAAALVFYNTELFEKAGAKVPATYEEWIDCCKKLQKAGITPIACSAGTPWCLSLLAGYFCDRAGGPDNLANVNAGNGSWLDTSFKNGVGKLKELSLFFQKTAAGDSNDQATAAFYNGECAMLVQGSWAIAQINGANSDFESKCGVFSFPAIKGGADPNRMIVKTDNLVMSSTTTHQDAAIALMKMFTDDEAQRYTAEVAGKIPVTGVSFDLDKAPKQLGYVKDILAKSTGTLGFYNESLATTEAGDAFDNAMVDIFLGSYSVDEGLQKVEDFYKKNIWK
ncbi:MAG: extracellular solute-binding protein [Treponema sp.]|nr:extracellular solute-binding protein [Treponema sp.]